MRYSIIAALAVFTGIVILQSTALADDYGISGTWYHGDTPTHISVEHKNRILLDNGEGSRAMGYFTDPWHIQVPDWGVNGQVTHNGRRISWSNGTTWTRYPDKQTHVSGRWYHDGKPTRIEVYDNGWRFTIINEDGQRSNGVAKSAHVLYIPSLHITGYINQDATKIRWTNGTVWTRSGGGEGPIRGTEN